MCFEKRRLFFKKIPEKLTPEPIKKYTGLAGRNLDAVFDRHGPMVTKRASDPNSVSVNNFLADPRPPYFVFFRVFRTSNPLSQNPIFKEIQR